MKRELLAAVVTTLALLSGCAGTPTIHGAFEGIANETQNSDTSLIKFHNLITLNGLMPLHVPGMLFLEPGASTASSAASPPSLLIGISPKRSVIVDARYPEPTARDDVKSVQDAYLAVRAAAIAQVAQNLKVELIKQLQDQQLNSENRDLIVKALNLNNAADAKGDVAATELKTAQQELASDNKSLAEKLETFAESVKDNMVVLNWTKDNEYKGLLSHLSFLQANGGGATEQRGVLILAGLRVVNTLFGEDLYCMAANAGSNGGQAEKLKMMSITTNLIQAQAVGYVSDLTASETLSASLGISEQTLQDLVNSGAIPKDAQKKFSASALIASAMEVSNFGRMSDPEITARPYRFFPARRESEDLVREINEASHYITVSVTRAQLTDGVIAALEKSAKDIKCAELDATPDRTLGKQARAAHGRLATEIAEAESAAKNLASRDRAKAMKRSLDAIGKELGTIRANSAKALRAWAPTIGIEDAKYSKKWAGAFSHDSIYRLDPVNYDLTVDRLRWMKVGAPLNKWYWRAEQVVRQAEADLNSADEGKAEDLQGRLTKIAAALLKEEGDAAPSPPRGAE